MAFPQEKIEQYRQTFQEEGFQTEIVEWQGKAYLYYVIPESWSKLPKTLPQLFALQLVPALEVLEAGDPSACSLFGVSSAIDAEFRPLVALHEVLEYVIHPLHDAPIYRQQRLPIPSPWPRGCCRASEVEWQEVKKRPVSFQRRYVAMRVKFFGDFLEYAQKSPGITPEQRKEFDQSRNFWEAQELMW